MKEISELLKEIMGLAFEVNSTTEHDVFVRFFGHVNNFEIEIYKNGWTRDSSANIRISLYLAENDTATELNQAIKILENLKGGKSNV